MMRTINCQHLFILSALYANDEETTRHKKQQKATKSNKKRRAKQLNQGKSALSLPFVKRLKCTRHGQEKKDSVFSI